MGRRHLDIHSDLFTGLFKAGFHPAYEAFKDSLPDDTRVVGVEMLDIGIDRYHGAIRFHLESNEWPDGEVKSISPVMRLVNGEGSVA